MRGRWQQVVAPVMLLGVFVLLTVLLWQRERRESREDVEAMARLAQVDVGRRAEAFFKDSLKRVNRLRQALAVRRPDQAARIFKDDLEKPRLDGRLNLATWLDGDGTCHGVLRRRDEKAVQEAELDGSWDALVGRTGPIATSQLRGTLTVPIGPPVERPGRNMAASVVRLAAAVPPGEDELSADGKKVKCVGVVVAELNVGLILGALSDKANKPGYRIWLRDAEDRVVYRYGTTADEKMPWDGEPLKVQGAIWHVSALPPVAVIASLERSARRVLWGGLTVSVLAAGVLLQGLRHRWKEKAQLDQHVAALELLTRTSIGINAKLGTGREVLDDLAESAVKLLGMAMSNVSLLDEARGGLEVVAIGGTAPASAKKFYPMDMTPMSRKVLEDGEVYVEGDVDKSTFRHNRASMARLGVKSAIVLPMFVGAKAVGVMMVGDTRPRKFSQAERRLAELLSSQASVILANGRLWEQMRAALDGERRVLAQREELFAANAAIYQAGTLEQTLSSIAELAPRVLAVDSCGVTLPGERDGEMVMAAVTRPYVQDLIGVQLSRGVHTEYVLSTGKPVVVENAASDPGVHAGIKARMNPGSLLYMPMTLGGDGGARGPRVNGALVLMRLRPGPFSQEDQDGAAIFAARAAAAIESARLHERARRDAEAKAMLLRELNHRVKNNLAGIVGLLSVNEPEMPAAAKQWLSRAVDRIGTMARAHELFALGVEEVSVAELVKQVLPSLALARPQGVTIRTEVDGVGGATRLGTDRAVNVAIVLHELCYNAMVHGVGETGTVTIQVRDAGGGAVAIDVIDDGSAAHGHPHGGNGNGNGNGLRSGESRGTGVGLTLVGGLVRRELRGRFSLARRPEGGMVATAEFPAADHSCGRGGTDAGAGNAVPAA